MHRHTPDLSLVSTKDLIDAACSRFDTAVFHGIIDRNAPTPDEEGIELFAIRCVGDPLKCAGMTLQIQRHIFANIDARTIPSDGSQL